MASALKQIAADKREDIVLEEIRRALRGLQYGCITITVQDGVVVQIDKATRHRIDYSELERVTSGEGI